MYGIYERFKETETHTQGGAGKAGNRNCIWEDPDVGVSKDFKATIINMFKDLKETSLKELKEQMMTK